MLVWGGIADGTYVNDGALYDPRTDTWTPISSVSAPSPRLFFAASWDSTNLFIWGGVNSHFQPLSDGALYNTVSGTWRRIARTDAPAARSGSTAVWSGKPSSFGAAPTPTETRSARERNSTQQRTGGRR